MINYTDLGLMVDKTKTIFKFQDLEIEFLNYLPVKDKYDLVMTTIQKSKEGNYYNIIKLNMFFKLHLVYMYTNLVFSKDDYFDEAKLYDELESSGFLNEFLKVFPSSEYNTLFTLIQELVQTISTADNSAGAIVSQAIRELPTNAEKALGILKELNPDTFKDLINTANTIKR